MQHWEGAQHSVPLSSPCGLVPDPRCPPHLFSDPGCILTWRVTLAQNRVACLSYLRRGSISYQGSINLAMWPLHKTVLSQGNTAPHLLSGTYFFCFSLLPFHHLLQFHFKIPNFIWWTSKSFLLYNEFEANGNCFSFLSFNLVNPVSGSQMRLQNHSSCVLTTQLLSPLGDRKESFIVTVTHSTFLPFLKNTPFLDTCQLCLHPAQIRMQHLLEWPWVAFEKTEVFAHIKKRCLA